MRIRAIETAYAGYRMRSRTEAHWAIFFDALQIPWEYEKEGFDLGDGVLYLPDFWLPRQNCWIEVKGDSPTPVEIEKAKRLACDTGKIVFMFFGHFGPVTLKGDDIVGSNLYFAPSGESDGCASWGHCPICHQFIIGHFGRHDATYTDADLTLLQCTAPNRTDAYSDNSDWLMKAYSMARSARFEHGEHGGRRG